MPPRTIVLPVKCSTVKRIGNASVLLITILIWGAWIWSLKIWLGLPLTVRSVDGFAGIVFFLILNLAYTVFCAIPKLPKFTCIKDEPEEP